MTRFAYNMSESSCPGLWSGLFGALRVTSGLSGEYSTAFLDVKYDPLGSRAAPSIPSPGVEVRGNAIDIDANSYLRRYPITITYPYTVAVWFRQVDSTNYGDIASLADTAGNNWILFTVESGGAGLHLDCRRYNGSFAATQSSGTVSLGVWHHCVMEIQSTSSITCYLDGFPVITASTSIASASNWTTVGVGRFLYGTSVSGTTNAGNMIGEFLEYNRALSASEIRSLASGASPLIAKARRPMVGKAGASITKPWLYRRSSTVSRPYLQVA